MGKKNEIQDTVTAVLAAICEVNEVKETGTDFSERGKFIVSTYNDNGSLYLRHEADSKAEAKAWLQKPENLGKKITISKEVVALTTDIPLTEVNEDEEA